MKWSVRSVGRLLLIRPTGDLHFELRLLAERSLFVRAAVKTITNFPRNQIRVRDAQPCDEYVRFIARLQIQESNFAT